MLSSSQENPTWPDDQTYALSAESFRLMQALLPPSVLLLAAPVGNWMDDIHPSERECVRRAVLHRQAEFSTGRKLAAQALVEIDRPVSAVLRGQMHEPIWPAGAVGSITHTKEICLVAVARTSATVDLGIDIEADRPEFDNLGHLILRPEEQPATGRQGQSERDFLRLVFGAKESVY